MGRVCGWGVGMCGPYPKRRDQYRQRLYGRREHALLEEQKEDSCDWSFTERYRGKMEPKRSVETRSHRVL